MREIGTRERGRKWPEQEDIDKEREEGRGESVSVSDLPVPVHGFPPSQFIITHIFNQ